MAETTAKSRGRKEIETLRKIGTNKTDKSFEIEIKTLPKYNRAIFK